VHNGGTNIAKLLDLVDQLSVNHAVEHNDGGLTDPFLSVGPKLGSSTPRRSIHGRWIAPKLYRP